VWARLCEVLALLLGELADLRQVGQGIDVEDCHARALSPKEG